MEIFSRDVCQKEAKAEGGAAMGGLGGSGAGGGRGVLLLLVA